MQRTQGLWRRPLAKRHDSFVFTDYIYIQLVVIAAASAARLTAPVLALSSLSSDELDALSVSAAEVDIVDVLTNDGFLWRRDRETTACNDGGCCVIGRGAVRGFRTPCLTLLRDRGTTKTRYTILC